MIFFKVPVNLKCIFTKNWPIDFSSLCSVVFTCIVRTDFSWVFFFSHFFPLISVSTYQFQDASQLSLDVILSGILVDLVYLVVFTGERAETHFGSAFCRLAQRSKSTGVQLLEGMSLSSSECWKLLRCPGKPWQRTWGPEYLGFPLRNSRISPESSDLREPSGSFPVPRSRMLRVRLTQDSQIEKMWIGFPSLCTS